jgi:hypothetical protein
VGPDLTFNGGGFDAFVAKINPAGTALNPDRSRRLVS